LERIARTTGALGGAGRVALGAGLGVAMAAAQPPLSLPWVLFFALPPLFWLLAGCGGWRPAALLGWSAGTGYFAAALFWIVEPFQVDSEAHGWMAPFALAGMAGGLALFWALAFGVAGALGRDGWRGALGLACLLTLAEVARTHVLTGFPWALVGYAWVETPVMQAASLIGVHGVGFLTLVAALAPAVAAGRAGRGAGVAVAVLLVGLGWGWGAARLAAPVPERAELYVVRIVQPNAPQHLKWRADMQALYYERHLALSAAEPGPAGPPDVVLWSETAVPFVLGYADGYQAEIVEAAGVPVILGIRRVEVEPDAERWFNALAVLGEGGRAKAVYDKHHLVPFGEYIPFNDLVARLGLPGLETLTRGGFTPGEGPRLVGAPGVPPFLPLVCYEAIFPHQMTAPEGRPEWLVQVTNDAWFGTLAGPYQHFAQNRVRAIEQGLPLARAANTGISAMVDPMGRVVAGLELGVAGQVDAALPAALAPTPYARAGDAPVLATILIIFGLTVANFSSGKHSGNRA
jgi:apolipoprotein N-acyltransferase